MFIQLAVQPVGKCQHRVTKLLSLWCMSKKIARAQPFNACLSRTTREETFTHSHQWGKGFAQVCCLGAYPLYGALSQRGLLDAIKLAYNESWRNICSIGCHDVRTYKDLWTFMNEKWINPYSKVVLLWFWNYCWQSVMVGFGGGVSWVSVSVVSKLHVYTTVIQFNILLQNKISQQASSIEL